MRKITFASFRLPMPFILLCFMVLLAGGASYRTLVPAAFYTMTQPTEEVLPSAEIGAKAPDFTLTLLDGSQTASLSSFSGRSVIVYFWATWCPHCREAAAQLKDLYEKHEEEGLAVLAVNILESPETVHQYLETVDLPFPILLDRHGDVSDRYLVRATPTFYLVDREGVLRDIIIGVPRRGALEGRLAPLFAVDEGESMN